MKQKLLIILFALTSTIGWAQLQPLPKSSWTLTGNSSTTAGTNFIGNIDSVDLVFKTNNTERARIKSNGNVGIGITSPTSKLHINGNQIHVISTDTSVGSLYEATGGWRLEIKARASKNLIRSIDDQPISIEGNSLPRAVFNNTKVGLFTSNPQAALDVSSTTGGILVPRLTSTQISAIVSPSDGLILYNTTTTKFQIRTLGSWVDIIGSNFASGASTDSLVTADGSGNLRKRTVKDVVSGYVKSGTGTLSSGTATISTTAITANSRIIVSYKTVSGATGILAVPSANRTVGTSFVVNSLTAGLTTVLTTDNSTFDWVIID